MRKLFLLLLCFVSIQSYAQFSTYSSDEVLHKFVGEVDDMNPYEIKIYNNLIKEKSDTFALLLINCERAYYNLKEAPATILNINFSKDDDGKINMILGLINSTPKTIKRATFTFEFANYAEENVYDTKTGKRYLTISFENLKGRTINNEDDDVTQALLQCCHELDGKEEISGNTFYNKNADKVRIVKALIRYTNGTSSQNIAIFEGDGFFENGPLEPIASWGNKFLSKEEIDDGDDDIEDENEEIVDTTAEIMPQFRGDVNRWLALHLNYPPVAAENGVQGKVIVRFVVGKSGKIRNASIIKSVDPALDREALRVVNSMPRWTPGYNKGKRACVWFALPITFKLTDEDSENKKPQIP